MIEAVLVMAAILLTGGFAILAYEKQQEKNRGRWESEGVYTRTEIATSVDELRKAVDRAASYSLAVTEEQHKAWRETIAPLCETLAESLQAQMRTIQDEQAVLRTRVETGPGKRTIRL